MRTTLFFILLIIWSVRPTAALPPLERLTPQNLHRLEQVGSIRIGTIEELAWSEDDSKLAIAGSGGVRVYLLGTYQELVLSTSAGGVNDVDFSPDGREVVSAGDDGMLRIWNANTGRPLRTLTPYADFDCGCPIRITSAKYTADGTRLWVGAENAPLRVIDARTGAVEAQHDRFVLEIVPDATRMRFAISEQRSPRLSIWPASGTFAPTIELDTRFTVWNAAFVPGTNYIMVAGFVGTELSMVNINTGETIDTMGGARVLHVGRSGGLVTQLIEWIGNTRRMSLSVRDVNSGFVQFYAPLDVELTDARFSPSGSLLAISDASGRLTVWEWRRNQIVLEREASGTALIGLALMDGGLAASIDSGVGIVQTLTRTGASAGSTIRLWDIVSGRAVSSFQTTTYGLLSADTLYWDKDFDRLIIGSTMQPDMQLSLNPLTGEVHVISQYNIQLLSDEQYYDDSPDGLLRAEALNNDDVLVSEYGIAANAVLLPVAGPALQFDTSGTLLLTTGPSGVIRLWGVRAVVPAPD